jgi:Protein of unknown function (DUF669)
MTQSDTLDAGFDVDNEEGTPPLSLLPKGKYKAEITDATVGPTKNGKGQAVSLTWTITEGEYEHRLLFQRILIQHDSPEAQKFGRMKFKDVCAACGITGTITDLSVLCLKPCLVSVTVRKDEGGQYDDKNEISRVSPVVNWNGDEKKRQLLKDASATPKAFEATDEKLNDEIPW